MSNRKRVLSVAGVAVLVAAAAASLGGFAARGGAAAAVGPANSSPPTVSGTVREGSTLTASTGSWNGAEPITFTYAWLRCDKDGGSCSTISGANANTYPLKTVDVANTLRVRVTAHNADGTVSATSVPTAVVAAAQTTPSTTTTSTTTTTTPNANGCAPGQSSGTVPITNVSIPQRLLVDRFSVSPGVIHRDTNDLTVQVHVATTCGASVSGAIVYAAGVPFNQFSIPSEQQTDGSGMATLTMHRLGGFPAARQQRLFVMMIRARKSGENVLAGVSTRRLVSSRVDLRTSV
jgi:hypothetical protein